VVRHGSAARWGLASCRERVRQRRPALGWQGRRRRHRPCKATPEAHAVFVAEVEERRAEWPADWALGCGDEATVRRQPTRTAQGCQVADILEVLIKTLKSPVTTLKAARSSPYDSRPPLKATLISAVGTMQRVRHKSTKGSL
jgi:hypothetical protein